MDEVTLGYTVDNEAPPALVGAKIGRYQLLELVGSGGMGMVWGAWDPELERRVALKLVRIVADGARERMLREGQVLARLSHPNVVPIYDVGVMGAQIYLVMEWVRGETLRAFADGKPGERALVDAYRQAGAGLAAAHDAGVVHRDFKPANVIRGDDGRVRVLDFGIAADEASRDAPAVGTPRYMAPEQRLGDAATVASDQYAFCISLLEAFGPDATPPWIGAIIERGTDPDPAKRFASMHALLDALARDPARRRRRAAMGVVLVGAAVGAFAIGHGSARSDPTALPCSGAAAELATSWNPALRDRVAAHLASLGPAADTKLAAALDAYGRDWIATHERTCRANERKELSPALYTTRLDCLARTRFQLAAVGELLSNVTAETLPDAVLAARTLPDVNGCAEITTPIAPAPAASTSAVQAVIPEVERALVLATAKRPEAADAARTATTRARATRYEPLLARALLVEGRAVTVDVREDGHEIFAEAMRHALRVSDDALAVEAYARWLFAMMLRGEISSDGWAVMVEIAERLGRAGRFARALMYNNRAVAYLGTDPPKARELLLAARDAAGDLDDLELQVIGVNFARLERDPDAYAAALRAVYGRVANALGADHPDALIHALPLALLEHDRSTALAAMREVCAANQRLQQYEMARLCAYEAAMFEIDGGNAERASALMEDVIAQSRALELRDELVAWITGVPTTFGDIRQAIAEAYLAITRGAPDRAARIATLEQRIATRGAMLWEQLEAVDGLIVLGQWVRAEERFRNSEVPIYVRKKAQIARGLATALAVLDPKRARALAEQARAFYARDPSASVQLAELEALLRESR